MEITLRDLLKIIPTSEEIIVAEYDGDKVQFASLLDAGQPREFSDWLLNKKVISIESDKSSLDSTRKAQLIINVDQDS